MRLKNINYGLSRLYGDDTKEVREKRKRLYQVPNTKRYANGERKPNNGKPQGKPDQGELFDTPEKKTKRLEQQPDYGKHLDEAHPGKQPIQGDLFRENVQKTTTNLLKDKGS